MSEIIYEEEIVELTERLAAAEAQRDTLAAEVERLRFALHQIRFLHHPDVITPGKEPIGCLTCYPADGAWPCTTRMEADDALAALTEETAGE